MVTMNLPQTARYRLCVSPGDCPRAHFKVGATPRHPNMILLLQSSKQCRGIPPDCTMSRDPSCPAVALCACRVERRRLCVACIAYFPVRSQRERSAGLTAHGC